MVKRRALSPYNQSRCPSRYADVIAPSGTSLRRQPPSMACSGHFRGRERRNGAASLPSGTLQCTRPSTAMQRFAHRKSYPARPIKNHWMPSFWELWCGSPRRGNGRRCEPHCFIKLRPQGREVVFASPADASSRLAAATPPSSPSRHATTITYIRGDTIRSPFTCPHHGSSSLLASRPGWACVQPTLRLRMRSRFRFRQCRSHAMTSRPTSHGPCTGSHPKARIGSGCTGSDASAAR